MYPNHYPTENQFVALKLLPQLSKILVDKDSSFTEDYAFLIREPKDGQFPMLLHFYSLETRDPTAEAWEDYRAVNYFLHWTLNRDQLVPFLIGQSTLGELLPPAGGEILEYSVGPSYTEHNTIPYKPNSILQLKYKTFHKGVANSAYRYTQPVQFHDLLKFSEFFS